MKKCIKCKKTKPLKEFSFRSLKTGKRYSYCRDCKRIENQKHYCKNREVYNKRAKTWKRDRIKEVRNQIWKYLDDHPCVGCGETDHVVLEFDHICHKKDKVSDICKMVRSCKSWSEVHEEIKKCEVRCANCHRRRTAKQCNWYT